MNKIIEQLKVWLWMQTRGRKFRQQYRQIAPLRQRLKLHDSWETIQAIREHHLSACRFGDGELQIVDRWLQETSQNASMGGGIDVDTFQHYDSSLGKRLYEILQSAGEAGHIVCVPYAFKDSSAHRGYARIFFERETLLRMPTLGDLMCQHDFYDAAFTRFYLERHDITDYPTYIAELRSIWQGRDILFVEGEQSRLGVGNNLFDNATSIQRILCPATNAWGSYTDILKETLRHANNKLVLIALGQTATVLAYDLSKAGIQAIDLGHVDVEYEWYRMGATSKVPIPGKYVNEATGGRSVTKHPEEGAYQSQIIARIGL